MYFGAYGVSSMMDQINDSFFPAASVERCNRPVFRRKFFIPPDPARCLSYRIETDMDLSGTPAR